MIKLTEAILGLGLLLSPAIASAQPITLTFEDLSFDHATEFPPISDGYGGFEWVSTRVINPSMYSGGGYDTLFGGGVVSGTNVAINGPGMTISANTLFDFNGGYFSSGDGDPVSLWISGYQNGGQVFIQELVFYPGPAQYHAFDNLVQVDTLVFEASKYGTAPPIFAVFTMDDLSFNVVPIPEPETYALMLAGLGLVGFVARRRKQQVTCL